MASSGQQGPTGLTQLERQRLLLRSALRHGTMCDNPRPCRYGDRCIFAHNQDEVRVMRAIRDTQRAKGEGDEERYEGPRRPRPQRTDSVESGERFHPHSRYKTALCHNWQRSGSCRHGEACNFAHGEADLRRTHSYGGSRFQSGYGAAEGDAPADGSYAGGYPSEPEGGEQVEVPAELAAQYPEEYRLQQQYDQQRQERQLARKLSGEAAAAPPPAPPAGSPPKLEDTEHFPRLAPTANGGGAAAAGAAAGHSRQGSQVSSDGAGAPALAKHMSLEWDGSSTTSSAPATVCLGEARLKPELSSGGGSAACSERSLAMGEGEEGGGGAQEARQPSGATPAGAAAPQQLARGAAAAPAGAAGTAPQKGSSWADMDDEGCEAVQQQQQPALVPAAAAPSAQPAPGPPSASVASREAAVSQADPAVPEPALAAAPAAAAAPPSAHPVAPNPSFQPTAAPYQPPLASPTRPAAPVLPLPPPAAMLPPPSPAGMPPPGVAHRPAFLPHLAAGHLDVINAFLCPLSGRPFVNPVVAADGITYEKEVITDWLYRQNKEVSPLTGKPLPHRLILPNDTLRQAMGQVGELFRALAT